MRDQCYLQAGHWDPDDGLLVPDDDFDLVHGKGRARWARRSLLAY